MQEWNGFLLFRTQQGHLACHLPDSKSCSLDAQRISKLIPKMIHISSSLKLFLPFSALCSIKMVSLCLGTPFPVSFLSLPDWAAMGRRLSSLLSQVDFPTYPLNAMFYYLPQEIPVTYCTFLRTPVTQELAPPALKKGVMLKEGRPEFGHPTRYQSE